MYGVLIFFFGCEVFRCVSLSQLLIFIAWFFSLHGVVAILLDQHSSRCNCNFEEMFSRVLFLFFVLLGVEVAASVEEVVVNLRPDPSSTMLSVDQAVDMLHFSQLSRQAHVDEYYVRKQKLLDVEMKSFEYELEQNM